MLFLALCPARWVRLSLCPNSTKVRRRTGFGPSQGEKRVWRKKGLQRYVSSACNNSPLGNSASPVAVGERNVARRSINQNQKRWHPTVWLRRCATSNPYTSVTFLQSNLPFFYYFLSLSVYSTNRYAARRTHTHTHTQQTCKDHDDLPFLFCPPCILALCCCKAAPCKIDNNGGEKLYLHWQFLRMIRWVGNYPGLAITLIPFG